MFRTCFSTALAPLAAPQTAHDPGRVLAHARSDSATSSATSPGSLGRTLIGEWKKGRSVNLERALRAGDRFGGHFVEGHVDGVGTVAGVAEVEDAMLVDIRVPPEVEETTVLHGAITVDGVSLTVHALAEDGIVQVSLVPFTREHTTLGKIGSGDRVHVEADVLGKYVRQLCRSAQ